MIVIDAIEKIFEFNPIGPRFSLAVLGTLDTVLTERPPPGHHLLILTTTSHRQALADLGLRPAFKHQVHVPAITSLPGLGAVLGTYLGPADVADILECVRQDIATSGARFAIGVQDLLAVVAHAAGDEENAKETFLSEFQSFYHLDRLEDLALHD